MDSSIIAAVSALLGSAVGGLTTFATTFFNQRYVARREMLVKDVANREQLYAEFLKEVADLYRGHHRICSKSYSKDSGMIPRLGCRGRS